MFSKNDNHILYWHLLLRTFLKFFVSNLFIQQAKAHVLFFIFLFQSSHCRVFVQSTKCLNTWWPLAAKSALQNSTNLCKNWHKWFLLPSVTVTKSQDHIKNIIMPRTWLIFTPSIHIENSFWSKMDLSGFYTKFCNYSHSLDKVYVYYKVLCHSHSAISTQIALDSQFVLDPSWTCLVVKLVQDTIIRNYILEKNSISNLVILK